MTTSSLLLDTCALIWIGTDEPIAAPAREAVEDALDGGEPIFVSPITAWEIGLLAARRRIVLSMSATRWFERMMKAPGLRLAAMQPDVLIASSSLPGSPPGDPADRIIATTAREYGYRLVTRDRRLLSYAAQGFCQALAC